VRDGDSGGEPDARGGRRLVGTGRRTVRGARSVNELSRWRVTADPSGKQMFCQNLVNIQTPFIAANEKIFAAWPSPVPTVGDTLYTFLASRLASSFDNLKCANFGLHQTVTVVNNGAGAATQATLQGDDPQVAGF
jgi:hypothetical protein